MSSRRAAASKRDELLKALKSGPVTFRELMHGRSAIFRLAYKQLLQEGLIEESGSGNALDPRYVGLKGAAFPEKGYPVRGADVALLVRSGMNEVEARAALQEAIKARGEAAVVSLCEQAHQRILSFGKNPVLHKPPKPIKGGRYKPIEFSLGKEELLNEKDF
jgi:hypothetical protein